MTASGKRNGPGRPRSERSERAILDATFELLAKKGYAGLSLDAVARQAQVSKATIYRRWPSKQHLVLAAFETTPELHVPDTGDLEADLVRVVTEFVELYRATRLGGVLPIIAGECAHNPALSKALDPVIARRRKPVRTILERGVERGELAAGLDLEMAVDAVMGLVIMRLFFSSGPVNAPALKAMIAIALHGLGYNAQAAGERRAQ